MSQLKIVVAYDKSSEDNRDILQALDPSGEIYVPVMGGHALGDIPETFADMQGDDDGENISTLNPYVHEVSHLYWAWKNLDKLDNPEYIGLCQYRRMFPPIAWEYNGLEPHTFVLNVIGYGHKLKNSLEKRHGRPTQVAADNILDQMFTEQVDREWLAKFKLHETYPACNCFIMPATAFNDYMTYVNRCVELLQPVIADSGEEKTYPLKAASVILEYLNGVYLDHACNVKGYTCHHGLIKSNF